MHIFIVDNIRNAHIIGFNDATKNRGCQMNATITKIKDAQPMGEYKPTSVDVEKKVADFRLVAVGKKNTIVWLCGKLESITDRQLEKLQSQHSWACDF